MTEAEWLACEDPRVMLEFLRARLSSRKLICFFQAFCPDFTSYSTDGEEYGSDLDFRPPWLDVEGPEDEDLPSADRCWGWAKLITFPDFAGKDKTRPLAVAAPLLRELVGNPFHPITLSPSWLTSTVVSLANQMYESRDFSAMPILADALMDASCDNEEILTHCRGPGPHVRGCWVLDLLTKRE